MFINVLNNLIVYKVYWKSDKGDFEGKLTTKTECTKVESTR